MKYLILTFSLFIFSTAVKAQNNLKKCYVPEINFTFYVPKEYKAFVPRLDGTYLDEHFQPITDKRKLGEITKDDPKIILQIERKTDSAFFQMKIQQTPITENNKTIIGDSVFYKKLAIALAKQSDKFDTTFTSVKIDACRFNKSVITNYINETSLYTCSYTGIYKNYYLSIGIVTTNKKEAEHLMSYVEEGKFNRK